MRHSEKRVAHKDTDTLRPLSAPHVVPTVPTNTTQRSIQRRAFELRIIKESIIERIRTYTLTVYLSAFGPHVEREGKLVTGFG